MARLSRSVVVRLGLYHLAQARERAEYRGRWGRGRLSGPGGVGGCDRPSRPDRHLPLRHHLLLDAPALLGAGAHQAPRLCKGRSADAAGGPGRAVYEARNADLHVDARAPHTDACSSGSVRLAVRDLSRSPRCGVPVVLPSTLDPYGDTCGLEVVPVFA